MIKLTSTNDINLKNTTLESDSLTVTSSAGAIVIDNGTECIAAPNMTMSAKNVEVKNSVFNIAAPNATSTTAFTISATSNGNVTVEDVTIKGEIGGVPGQSTGQLYINTNGEVTVNGCAFIADGYDCLGFSNSGNTKPTTVTITNCLFDSTITRNVINFFKLQNNAVVTIKNCTFGGDFSQCNLIRFNNTTNATGIVFNIEDCTFNSWATVDQYQGLFMFEDSTSTNAATTAEANRFSPEKITVNIKNCTDPDGNIMTAPTNMTAAMGSGTSSQIAYIWAYPTDGTARALIAYDESKYPTFNFS